MHIDYAHQRAVNRICWRHDEPHNLLSASQDNTMKLIDIRTGNVVLTFNSQSEVRDAQFNHSYTTHFASALDSGNIEIWDLRKPDRSYNFFRAHDGPIFTLAWNPLNKNVLASGGRSRLISIWDLFQNKEIAAIQTISGVHQLVWRPDFGDGNGERYISSCSNIGDNSVHIWDIKKPYRPLASLVGAKDVTTSHIWTQSNTVMTCSKDGHLRTFDIERHCYLPNKYINTSTMTFDIHNNFSFTSSKIDRDTNYLSVKKPIKAEIPPHTERIVNSINMNELGIDSGFNPTVFKTLAEKYRFRDGSISELCLSNAEASYAVKNYQVSQVWHILNLMYSDFDDAMSSSAIDASTFDATPIDDLGEQIEDNSAVDTPNLFAESNNISADHTPRPLSPSADDWFYKIITVGDDMNDVKDQDGPFDHPDLSSGLDFLKPPPVSGLDELVSPEIEKPRKTSVDIECLASIAAFLDNDTEWNPTQIVQELLDYYQSICDIQTCVYIGLILYDHIEFNSSQISAWTFSYVQMLQRFQLFHIANEIIKHSPIQKIKNMNKQSTSYPTSCPTCKKPIRNEGVKCDRCKTFSGVCSFCHLPVKGLFAWCQVCGHGGHLEHMTMWFEKETLCPSGCAHACNMLKRKEGKL